MLINSIKPVSQAFDVLAKEGGRLSFSHFGEDMVALAVLQTHNRLKNGFYVDIGCHNPWKSSNTALLSRFMNWKGINVDANQEAIAVFNQERTDDVNLNFAVSNCVSDVEYSSFDHSAVNTCDSQVVKRNINSSGGRFKLEGVTKMQTRTLADILDEHLPPGQEIDLLNIDVEGFDLMVLQGNDWEKYSPFLILIESIAMDFDKLQNNEIYNYLTVRGYKLVSQCFVTSIYRRVKK